MTAISTPLTSRRLTLPLGAAAAYISAWLVGLAIWPGTPGVDASATHVADAYAAHQGLAIVQYLLVEGVAGIALGAMVLAIGLGLVANGARRAGKTVLVSGLAAATISLAESVLGVIMAAGAPDSVATGSTADLFDLLNRMDGVKMFLLAAMVASVVNASRRPRLLPGWLHALGWALIAPSSHPAPATSCCPDRCEWLPRCHSSCSLSGSRQRPSPSVARDLAGNRARGMCCDRAMRAAPRARTLSRLPIRIRLTLAFAGVIAVVLGVAGVFLAREFSRDLDRSIDEAQRVQGEDISALVAGAQGPSAVAKSGERFAQVYAFDGRVLGTTEAARDMRLLSPSEVSRATERSLRVERRAAAGTDMRVHAAAVRLRTGERAVVAVGDS